MRENRHIEGLLHAVDLTQETEIDCTTCLEQIPFYVDRKLDRSAVPDEMPDLYLHLRLCHDCREEYEALRDLVALDSLSGLSDRARLLRQLGE